MKYMVKVAITSTRESILRGEIQNTMRRLQNVDGVTVRGSQLRDGVAYIEITCAKEVATSLQASGLSLVTA